MRGLRRDGVRLMVANPSWIQHTVFDRLVDQLGAGDVLVVNTSATVPGQLDGTRHGSAVVVHIANRLGDGTGWSSCARRPTPRLQFSTHGSASWLAPAGGVLELIEPYPKPDSSPTGAGIGCGVAGS